MLDCQTLLEESVVALMLSSEKPVGTHEALINDFIAKFPQANEGYYAKANLLVAQNDLVNADKVLQEEVNKATSKMRHIITMPVSSILIQLIVPMQIS